MIRSATLADVAAVASLHALCFDEAWSADAFGRLLQSPGTFALLVETDGRLCGFILVRAVAEEAEILSLGVLPAARRAGIAGTLVEAAAERAVRMAASRMFLEVGEENRAARHLYHTLGFRQVGERRGYYRRPDGTCGDALALGVDLPLPGSRLGKRPELD